MEFSLIFFAHTVMKKMDKLCKTVPYNQNFVVSSLLWEMTDFCPLQLGQCWILNWHQLIDVKYCETIDKPENPNFILTWNPERKPGSKVRDMLTTTPLFSSSWKTCFIGTENVRVPQAMERCLDFVLRAVGNHWKDLLWKSVWSGVGLKKLALASEWRLPWGMGMMVRVPTERPFRKP